MTRDQTQTSLRALALRLGCSHSALHKAVHDRRLTAGVRLDDRGRIHVVDADAAAAEWAVVHVPRIDQIGRRRAAPPRRADLMPVDLFDDISKQDLLECWAAFDELVTALVLDALEDADDPTTGALALMDRVALRLRDRGGCFEDAAVTMLDQIATALIKSA